MDRRSGAVRVGLIGILLALLSGCTPGATDMSLGQGRPSDAEVSGAAAPTSPAAGALTLTLAPTSPTGSAGVPRTAGVTSSRSATPTGSMAARSTRSASATLPGAAALTFGSGTESAVEARAVALVNEQRALAGCAPVTVNPILVTVARGHSLEMSTSDAGLRHNSADGRTPFQRMTAAGYRYSLAAENIAAGQPDAATVIDAWMNSPGHRANILNCRLTEVGVGLVSRTGSQYGTYWTQDFGTPL